MVVYTTERVAKFVNMSFGYAELRELGHQLGISRQSMDRLRAAEDRDFRHYTPEESDEACQVIQEMMK